MTRIKAIRKMGDGTRSGPCLRLLFCTLAAALAACGEPAQPTAPVKSSAQPAAGQLPAPQIDRFLDTHWARPIAPQGKPPARFTSIEAALDPGSCGTCHVAQLDDWRGSLHARAMGPGVLGQLADMKSSARDEHQECLRCHAPLAEQADSLAAALASGRGLANAPNRAPQPLHLDGVMCAACHVRGHQRYGPPRRDGSQAGDFVKLPHGGWISNAAFADSRFCGACHQFPKDGYALNGKLLENTYEEWKASRYAREGKTCQSCHMPDRRHLWRGIHDPEMTKSGVTIQAGAPSFNGRTVSARLAIRNSGTGHQFPTYVTPKVIVEGYQENAAGAVLPGTLRQYVIGRQVKLDLSEEIADTRLAPDQERGFDYRAPLNPQARAVVLQVRVEPDAFYTEFYRSLLDGKSAGKGARLIREAFDDSVASAYTLYRIRQPVPSR